MTPSCAENREYLTPLPEGAELLTPPVLHEPRRFRLLVFVATWGTLAMEALAAGLWLAPLTRRGLLVARHGVVLLFCLTTYAFAPVAGFGWLVIVLGLVTCVPDDRWLRRCTWQRTRWCCCIPKCPGPRWL